MYFKKFPKFLYDFDITKVVGEGHQAKATAYMNGGSVTSVSIDDPGSGYISAQITFSAPENSDYAATAFAVIENGAIQDIILTDVGAGYTSTPSVIISTPYTTLETETKALLLTDITRNIRFRRDILANVTVYDYYDIVDGETPEQIAEKIYGNAEYHWVIMLANDRYDYIGDFPLTYTALQQFISDKWGDQANSIHHYEDAAGNVVPANYPNAVPVTNHVYEENVNESKRRIKIISKDLISTIIKNFKDQL